jgi:hypothetical protein
VKITRCCSHVERQLPEQPPVTLLRQPLQSRPPVNLCPTP